MRAQSVVLMAWLLSSCFGPRVPNEDLARACRSEPANWTHQTVAADTVMAAFFVSLAEPQLNWTNHMPSGHGYSPCGRTCTLLLLRGFRSVEYLPSGASSPDRVWRYTFANEGDPRCLFLEDRIYIREHSPIGKCVAVETDVPRSARYALDLQVNDRGVHGLETWTYELVDLTERAVIAHGTEIYQRGWETPTYPCVSVHVDRGDAQEFVGQSIQPSGAAR